MTSTDERLDRGRGAHARPGAPRPPRSGLIRQRLRDSRIVVALIGVLLLVSRPLLDSNWRWHEGLEYGGYALAILCVFGRIWCSAYIGGYKNQRLLTVGPFSVVRNPLYIFSFIGILGIALMVESAVIAALLVGAFALYYRRVVRAEENNLRTQFAEAYEAYSVRVPRWLPKFSLFTSPDRIEMHPHFLLKAMRDGLWFLLAFPILELVEYLHDIGWLPTLFTLP